MWPQRCVHGGQGGRKLWHNVMFFFFMPAAPGLPGWPPIQVLARERILFVMYTFSQVVSLGAQCGCQWRSLVSIYSYAFGSCESLPARSLICLWARRVWCVCECSCVYVFEKTALFSVYSWNTLYSKRVGFPHTKQFCNASWVSYTSVQF